MANQTKISLRQELVAPCGMNCALCSAYQAYVHQIPRKRGKIAYCAGCRPRNKQCAYLKGRCQLLREGKLRFCFECSDCPCSRLKHLNSRYQIHYQVSLIENLHAIQAQGMDAFLKNQQERYRCSRCNGAISIHSRKCYHCDTIESWRG